MKSHILQKGQITIGVAGLITGISMAAAVLASYFTTTNTQNERITTVKADVINEISSDRQRITAVETDIRSIKENMTEQRNDIKEILRRLPK